MWYSLTVFPTTNIIFACITIFVFCFLCFVFCVLQNILKKKTQINFKPIKSGNNIATDTTIHSIFLCMLVLFVLFVLFMLFMLFMLFAKLYPKTSTNTQISIHNCFHRNEGSGLHCNILQHNINNILNFFSRGIVSPLLITFTEISLLGDC